MILDGRVSYVGQILDFIVIKFSAFGRLLYLFCHNLVLLTYCNAPKALQKMAQMYNVQIFPQKLDKRDISIVL